MSKSQVDRKKLNFKLVQICTNETGFEQDRKAKTRVLALSPSGDVWLCWDVLPCDKMSSFSERFGRLLHDSSVSLEFGLSLLESNDDPESLCEELRVTQIVIVTEIGTVTGSHRKFGWRYVATDSQHSFDFVRAGEVQRRVVV